jgi:hypothetical protein
LTLAAVIGLAALPASASAAARTITIDAAAPTQSWTGTATQGFNPMFFDSHLPGECGTDPNNYCDDTLVHFTSADALDESGLTFHIDGFDHSDFDLRVYTSDASGAVGDLIGTGKGEGTGLAGGTLPTWVGDPENVSTYADPDSWFLVRVVYFTVPGDEVYSGKLTWAGTVASPDAPEAP